MIGRREAVMEALKTKFSSMIDTSTDPIPAGKVREVTRRLRTFAETANKPSLQIAEASEDSSPQSENLSKLTMKPLLFLYIDTGLDPNAIPATQLNNLLDAIDVCLAPDNAMTNKCTLGGLVSHCYVLGEIPKAPGDLDGEGIAVIPLDILLPD